MGGIALAAIVALGWFAFWLRGGAKYIFLITLAGILLIGCLLIAPDYLVKRDLGSQAAQLSAADLAKAKGDARTALFQVLGGVLLLAGAFFTWRQVQGTSEQVQISQRQLAISEEAQVTERFSRAIDQLGSGKLDIRLGAINVLGRIGETSTKDRVAIVQVLSAYIRGHSSWPPSDNSPTPSFRTDGDPYNARLSVPRILSTIPPLRVRAPDVQAALSILGRGLATADCVDLRNVDLRKADLVGTNFEGSTFAGSHLEGAELSDSDLQHVNLVRSHLEGAGVVAADLREANLTEAYLYGASLQGSDLREAALYSAKLSGADLDTDTKLTNAGVDSGTTWPYRDTPDPAWHVHVFHGGAGIHGPTFMLNEDNKITECS